MTDIHERAQMMIALAERQSAGDQAWLAAHLELCVTCRAFAESKSETIRSLRSIPVMASAGLVSATRARVRHRALELHRQRERMWVVSACCAAVSLCTAISTVALWRGFVWMSGEWMLPRMSSPLLAIIFVALGVMPAIVAGIVMLSRGIHLADHYERFQG